MRKMSNYRAVALAEGSRSHDRKWPDRSSAKGGRVSEAAIVVPDRGNYGRDLSALRERVAAAMVAAFGGATSVPAEGFWQDNGRMYREPVHQIIAAAEPSAATDRALRSIADMIGQEGNQLAVYVRYPGGNVEILATAVTESTVP